MWRERGIQLIDCKFRDFCNQIQTITEENPTTEHHEGQSFQSSIVNALLHLQMIRDSQEIQNSTNRRAVAEGLAAQLDLDEETTSKLNTAAQLGNIGKIGVPEHILNKPGPLTGDEWDILKTHPQKARFVLESIPELSDVGDIIHQQNEKFDGSGYPQGLQGEQIRIEARVLSVASALIHLLAPRPYRDAYSFQEAVRDIEAQSGIFFDPEVVEVLVRHSETLRSKYSSL